MKTCTKCNETKDLNFFKKNPHAKDGLYTICSPCLTDRDREYNRTQRMFLNGKQIPKSHPLWKPGRYKALDDAWSHREIEQTKSGQVYVIHNAAWDGWYKVGKAVDAYDRLNGYQTSSPFRDYQLAHREVFEDRHVAEKAIHNKLKRMNIDFEGEWFYTDLETIKQVVTNVKAQEISSGYRDQHEPQLDLGLCY